VKTEFKSIIVELSGQVATIKVRHPKMPGGDIHWDLGEAFSDLRTMDEIRVIVLTGTHEGIFSVGPLTSQYDRQQEPGNDRNDPHRHWHTFTGLVRCHEAMAQIEKVIVAKLNGDAFAFGASILFGCDLIYARPDARVADNHLAMGELEPYGPRYGIVPGDGGMATVPLFMAPTLVKEYLMLGRVFTGQELADMHVINAAVPAEDLDAHVARVVERLLQRPAYALAWTKRVVNRIVVDQLNRTLDAGAGYEMVSFLQAERQGWKDRTEL
jgi:enoyl-CoA hydratase/carnithine racemase